MILKPFVGSISWFSTLSLPIREISSSLHYAVTLDASLQFISKEYRRIFRRHTIGVFVCITLLYGTNLKFQRYVIWSLWLFSYLCCKVIVKYANKSINKTAVIWTERSCVFPWYFLRANFRFRKIVLLVKTECLRYNFFHFSKFVEN